MLTKEFDFRLRDQSPVVEIDWTGYGREFRVVVTLTGNMRAPHETYVLRRLDESLTTVAQRTLERPFLARATFRLAGQRVECPVPFPEHLIPGFPATPESLVGRAIRQAMAFVEDREIASIGLRVSPRQDGAFILIESDAPKAEVARAAEAFVTASAVRPQELRSPPPGALTSPRVAALLTTGLAAITVGLSFVHLSWPGLLLLIATVPAGLRCGSPASTEACLGGRTTGLGGHSPDGRRVDLRGSLRLDRAQLSNRDHTQRASRPHHWRHATSVDQRCADRWYSRPDTYRGRAERRLYRDIVVPRIRWSESGDSRPLGSRVVGVLAWSVRRAC